MDNIGVFGTFGRKTLAIMLVCIGDGIRDSLVNKQRRCVPVLRTHLLSIKVDTIRNLVDC